MPPSICLIGNMKYHDPFTCGGCQISLQSALKAAALEGWYVGQTVQKKK